MTTAVLSPPRQSVFPRLALLPLAAIPFLGTSPRDLDLVVVAIALAFLALAVERPIWAVAALLTSELTIRNYYLSLADLQISMRLFLSLTSLLIILPDLKLNERALGPRGKQLLFLAIGFFLLTSLSNAIYSEPAYVLKFGRYLATGLIALVVVPVAVRNREDLLHLSAAGLVIATVSGVVAVLQHYSDRGAPLIELVPNDVAFPGFVGWGSRALGLAENPVYLTNDLLAFFFAPLALIFLLKPERARIYLGIVVLFLVALYFTQTRSWVLAAVPGTVAVALCLGGQAKQFLLILLVVGGLSFWLWITYMGNRYSQGPGNEDSAAARPVLWSASAQIAMDYPLFGVGHDKFLALSQEYAGSVDPGLGSSQDAISVLGTQQPHNDFLNIWLSFGTATLILYLLLFRAAIRNFLDVARRTSDPFFKGIAIGGVGALVAFAVNSSFHNFFDSTLTLWLFCGFSLALAKILAQDKSLEAGHS